MNLYPTEFGSYTKNIHNNKTCYLLFISMLSVCIIVYIPLYIVHVSAFVHNYKRTNVK